MTKDTKHAPCFFRQSETQKKPPAARMRGGRPFIFPNLCFELVGGGEGIHLAGREEGAALCGILGHVDAVVDALRLMADARALAAVDALALLMPPVSRIELDGWHIRVTGHHNARLVALCDGVPDILPALVFEDVAVVVPAALL